ncbi:MAG: RHS repeat domain-containing protein [Polyangiaceae bacterium]
MTDPRTGQLARRSVPVREDAPAAEKALFDLFEHDALGREVRHIAPWGAVTTTVYDGLLVEETDPLGQVTTTQTDALDHPGSCHRRRRWRLTIRIRASLAASSA